MHWPAPSLHSSVLSQLLLLIIITMMMVYFNKKGQLSLTNPRGACETFAGLCKSSGVVSCRPPYS